MATEREFLNGDPNDPELKVDSSVCSDPWDPPYDVSARKEHIKLPHPLWVTCTRCVTTWRYRNWWSWEGKYEGEQLRGHEVTFGSDEDT